MPRNRKTASISSLLSHVVDDLGLSQRLADARVEEAWREIAGPQAANVTRRVRMQDGRLTVYLTDATWRHAFFAQSEAWRQKLNERLGKEEVTAITFR